jgi:hypothetical protein
MKPTLNEKFIAYLTLLSGLSISAVAVYYSVVGLTAIFAAAVIPIIIMGTTLEVSKLVATVWLKQNWKTAPLLIKTYLAAAIVVLMVITSMGIFGFLSKAHSDQNLVSGDVTSKIAVYDEKIKTSKENIDANRKALKQLDEAVDQVMARSDSEKGADKAVAIRKTQSKERTRLQSEITAEQERITQLNEERAPIAAEVRKVEAEVGPIKYIAAFFYGSTDETILEKAVTWVIITLIVVFDPLAVILLLASQMSFQEFRERNKEIAEGNSPRGTTDVIDTEPPTVTEQQEEVDPIPVPTIPITNWTVTTTYEPVEEDPQGTEFEPIDCNKCGTELVDAPNLGLHCPNPECGVSNIKSNEDVEELKEIAKQYIPAEPIIETIDAVEEESGGYIQNEEQAESSVWTNTITKSEYAEVSDTEEHRRDVLINQWANLVRTRRAKMTDVPQHIVLDVRSRV